MNPNGFMILSISKSKNLVLYYLQNHNFTFNVKIILKYSKKLLNSITIKI